MSDGNQRRKVASTRAPGSRMRARKPLLSAYYENQQLAIVVNPTEKETPESYGVLVGHLIMIVAKIYEVPTEEIFKVVKAEIEAPTAVVDNPPR